MKSIVIYESMYGNTHEIAEHIAEGLRGSGEVAVVPTSAADRATLEGADLVVVGGPTHAHGMSSTMSRKAAAEDAEKHEHLDLDPDAEGPGLRDWFKDAEPVDGRAAAAFDTRFDASPTLTGRASKGIARRLRNHGYRLVAAPESFLVDKQNLLVVGEAERAREWGAALAVFAPPQRLG